MGETRRNPDPPLKPIVWTATGIAIFVIIAAIGLESVFHDTPPASPHPRQGNSPNLQSDPSEDLRRYEAMQRARRDRLDWVDREKGIAHIPVAAAMEIMASKGLAPHDVEPDCRPSAIAVPRAPDLPCEQSDR